jgi:hypothetical protein
MKWLGKEAIEKSTRALMMGIDKTTSDATIEAKRLVNIDTTTLQGSIFPEPAKIDNDGTVVGEYGPHDVAYAVEQEFLLGEQLPDGGTRQRKGGKPYMRPSMRKAEQSLMGNIIKAYKG